MNRFLLISALLLPACLLAQETAAPTTDGQTLYQQRCATCHQQPVNTRIPSRADLAKLQPQQVVDALEKGAMTTQAAGLSSVQIRALAAYVGIVPAGPASTATNNTCPANNQKPFNPGPNDWNGWGNNNQNTRFQPNPGLTAADVPKLKLKWAFGFPNDTRAVAQPAIVGGRIFVGSHGGVVYSLDLQSGCTYWSFNAGAIVRSGITLARLTPTSTQWIAFFGDAAANGYAVDAATGKQLWKVKLDDYPVARITGTSVFYNGRIYFPVSSAEELGSQGVNYVCCKFRGSLMSLDAATGKVLWKTYTIPDAAKVYKTTAQGRDLWGPAGASIWSAPTIDTKRSRIYASTGNSYTGVDIPTSDAVVAFDLESGKMLWSKQVTAGDNWLPGCPNGPLCPAKPGDDYDLASSPALITAGGKDLIVVGQKSGALWALDPEKNGDVVWTQRVGAGGGLMGGIMWGPAMDSQTAYAGVADGARADGSPGVYAINLADGSRKWKAAPPAGTGSTTSQPTAPSLMPGIVFSATFGGRLRAHQASTGEVVWEFDSAHTFETVNGVTAKGGSMDGAGPAIANGMVVMTSGMGFAGGAAGNVLLAFSVDGK
ncbi:MAG: PQQ-binding-like beta-propeller repeat protein [Acidobacteriota bacterium]